MQHQTVIRKAKKLWQQGQVVEASNQLGRYLAKNPKNPAVRLALAESLVGQSNEARALQVL
ncbi:MAG: tetratricopeptide repeat protein, partial [Rhodospirillales bacterium]|nr:tetratricopeptide repeat protein [Rhodospirillales bacterium]